MPKKRLKVIDGKRHDITLKLKISSDQGCTIDFTEMQSDIFVATRVFNEKFRTIKTSAPFIQKEIQKYQMKKQSLSLII